MKQKPTENVEPKPADLDWLTTTLDCHDGSCIQALEGEATMRLIIAILLTGCAGLNPVQVCSEQCQTGWYDAEGNLVTADHGLGDGDVVVTSTLGYRYDGPAEPIAVAHDVVTLRLAEEWPQDVCYATADPGDRVTVSTLYGPVRARVVASGLATLTIDKQLKPGDSGAPVTRRGCVVGVVRARTSTGTLIVRLGD